MDLDRLRKDAKALVKGYRAGDPAARERAAAVLGERAQERFQLSDAQHVVARECGYRTWPELKKMSAAVEAAARGERVEVGPSVAHDLLIELAQPNQDAPAEAILHVVSQADDLRDPINVAACFDRVELVQLLLDAGADPGTSPLWGVTALETALYHGARDSAELLAGRGIDPYALWSVAALGRVDLLPELLESPGTRRPNLEAVGWPPGPPPRDDPQEIVDEALCFAALNGRDDSVEWLLAHGADVDGAPYLGVSPLHFAAQFGRLSTVRLLLARGADASLRDRIHAGTPLGWAEHAGHLRVAAALGGRAEELVETGLFYREGEPVVVRVVRRDGRTWVTDDGRGAELAGRTRVDEDTRRELEREFAVNVDRHGRVFLPGERFVERIATASLALHQELLDQEE